MLKVEALSIGYNNIPLVSNLSFEVGQGESVSIIGPSGIGKSTLLQTIMGFIKPLSGTVLVNGIRLTDKTQYHLLKDIAFVPQDINFPVDTVEELISLLFRFKINRQEVPKKKILEIFEELGLSPDLFQKELSEISGGQKQRIMLVIAVALEKKMIIADEPTSALDEESIDRVLKMFKRLKSNGVSILATSHSSLFIENCDKIIKL